MRVAFYAPLKPPDHPVPSGDRRMARLLFAAMEQAGHQVELANRLRSRDGAGDEQRQARLANIGRARADRLLRRYAARPSGELPELWFTYHVYYKAPDWIGPRVAEALEIPYVVAEASVAHKRADGPWDAGHRATLAALDQAVRIVTLNPLDLDCLPDRSRARLLPPFLDVEPYLRAAGQRARHRNRLSARFGLDPEEPWIVTVAMMRPGDKLESYRVLGRALAELLELRWQLIVVGDGTARPEVEAALGGPTPDAEGKKALFERVHLAGQSSENEVAAVLAACDLMAWPAINEAFGMAFLEAQASGLPVVAGRSGGVAAVVHEDESGLLVEPGDPEAFTSALRQLLINKERRLGMAWAAKARATTNHALEVAATRLDQILVEAKQAGARKPVAALPPPEPQGADLKP